MLGSWHVTGKKKILSVHGGTLLTGSLSLLNMRCFDLPVSATFGKEL